MERLDLVYVLGNDSKWNNNELRFSLRSIEMYLKNYGNVYIVGRKPKWLTNVIHIPCEDTETPSQNILKKIKLACNKYKLTENFMFMNDDYFFTKEVSINNYPNYCTYSLFKETMSFNRNNWYRRYLEYTYEYLSSLSLEHSKFLKGRIPFFDVHYPIVYNRTKFLETFENFKMDKFVIKTIYGFINNIKETIIEEDCKVRGVQSYNTFKQFIQDKDFFSTGDHCINIHTIRIFDELYPNKSKYER